MSEEVADVLDAASTRLTSKWTTAQIREPATYTGGRVLGTVVPALDTCKVDAVGAICWAITGDPTQPGDLILFAPALAAADAQAVTAGAADLVAYNDAGGRTVTQVKTLLSAAATAERS